MAIGLELTLGNYFSHSSSLKNIFTLKRSFIFTCRNMAIALFSWKSSLEGTWDHTANCLYGILLLQGIHRSDCCQLLDWLHCQQAEKLLIRIISLLFTAAASVKRTVSDSLPRACATTALQSSAQHGDNCHYYSESMQSWIIYKYIDSDSLHLKNL